MRMWMVNPKILCRKHLLGEHYELHLFVGSLNKGVSVNGYLDSGLLEIHSIQTRHDQLVEEMIRRGMKHNSPLPEFRARVQGYIDVHSSLEELKRRCGFCRGKWATLNGTQRYPRVR